MQRYLPDRIDLKSQNIWEKIRKDFLAFDAELDANLIRVEQWNILKNWADKNQIPFPRIKLEEEKNIEKNLQIINQTRDKIAQAICAVENRLAAIRLSENGKDVDIIENNNLGNSNLGALPLLIIGGLGIVLIASLGATLYHVVKANIQVTKRLNDTIKSADKHLCAVPNSSQCLNWQAEKKNSGFNQRQNIVEHLTDEAKKLGKSVTSTFGNIAVLSIPILLGLYLVKK